MLFFTYSVIDWLLVFCSGLVLVPIFFLVKNYSSTSFIGYLLMTMVFLTSSVNIFLLALSDHISDLFLTKTQLITQYLNYFFLIIIVFYLKWEKISKLFFFINLIYITFLSGIIIFLAYYKHF